MTKGAKKGAPEAQPAAAAAVADGTDVKDAELERLFTILDEHIRAGSHEKVAKTASEVLVRFVVENRELLC